MSNMFPSMNWMLIGGVRTIQLGSDHEKPFLTIIRRGAKALKTLDDEGVLNGYAANFAANINEAHYKNNGVANGIAEETAEIMLRSNIEDRRRWCEKLVTGKTSICNVVKVIEAYRQAQATRT